MFPAAIATLERFVLYYSSELIISGRAPGAAQRARGMLKLLRRRCRVAGQPESGQQNILCECELTSSPRPDRLANRASDRHSKCESPVLR